MNKILNRVRLLLCCAVLLAPSLLFAQTKMREIKVGYPLGGSASYFWVSYRSGSFEKHGLKLEPIYIRGGLMGIQGALSGDLLLQLQGASIIAVALRYRSDVVLLYFDVRKLDYPAPFLGFINKQLCIVRRRGRKRG